MTSRLAQMSASFNKAWEVYLELEIDHPLFEAYREMLLLGIRLYAENVQLAGRFKNSGSSAAW